MFVIILDPLKIFNRGSEFKQSDFAITLWRGVWPTGMIVRNTKNQQRYEVFHDGGRFSRQLLRTLDGKTVLKPVNNGWLREMES